MKRKIPLANATVPQLREFASDNLGREFDHRASRAEILSTIKQAWHEDDVLVSVDGLGEGTFEEREATEAEVASQLERAKRNSIRKIRTMRGHLSRGDPRVQLTLHRSEEPGGDRAVPVTVEGSTALIPRGEPVDIPYRYYEVLKNAVKRTYADDLRNGDREERDIPRFAMSLHSEPPIDEVEAWQKAGEYKHVKDDKAA